MSDGQERFANLRGGDGVVRRYAARHQEALFEAAMKKHDAGRENSLAWCTIAIFEPCTRRSRLECCDRTWRNRVPRGEFM
jgi:hypothetical protein